jgi:hypothetical protein
MSDPELRIRSPIWVWAAALATLASCNPSEARMTDAGASRARDGGGSRLQPVRLRSGIEGAIVPAERMAPAAGYWTASEAEVTKFEVGLSAFLQRARPPEAPDLHKAAPGYKRQYFGITKDGKRLLFVFFFCRPLPGWQEKPVSVDDGGKCFFEVTYDPKADKYERVYVHHDA